MSSANARRTGGPGLPDHGRAVGRAFTIVELLIVIAIIAVLIALLLPAVQAAREAGRRSACANNVRQLAVAAWQHLQTSRQFPTGGWGHAWTGDPERGWNRHQPGGWVYNLLPFLEEQALHDRGAGADESTKRQERSVAAGHPLPLLSCPTRRPPTAYANNSPRTFRNCEVPLLLARADYAANCGDRGQNVLNEAGGPSSLAEGDSSYPWPNRALYTGVIYVRSEVAERQLSDGLSKTYLLGEKYANPQLYETGDDPSDWGHMYVGHGAETLRLAKAITPPLMDRYPISQLSNFGSAHAGSFNMAYCDASVHAVTYDIDPVVFQRFGNRSDHEVATESP